MHLWLPWYGIDNFLTCRLSGEESSLNGSYRQNSEFFKKEDHQQQQSCSRTEDDKSSDKAKATNQNISLTWDTLKKIRRQKSRRNANANSDLKKYQSSVCLLGPQNTFLSLQSDERQQRVGLLQHNLKYDEVYRSSPSLRSVQSFICHDGRQSARNNFTFSKQFSSSALKFTGR